MFLFHLVCVNTRQRRCGKISDGGTEASHRALCGHENRQKLTNGGESAELMCVRHITVVSVIKQSRCACPS